MKLKKLILAGFKSFADRTAFDFDDGVSAIVGPNGCGKSNVVDAFKWVLGEQSAKSLRGSEMMDVIFNGCATRKPAGRAEVTLVFDNAEGVLRPNGDEGDAPPAEVAVGRRLYRNGQSEYLINKAPARLKDIREMFMDTGIGVDAYSLIEQGRVEVFLQSSQDDRRAIFDEAAGISRYKARRKEALRKLDRVEQNLLRLNDIQAEVEKRLRSIKQQAGKARNYQAYSERLKELRSLFFLAQYHKFQQQRDEVRRRLDEAVDAHASLAAQVDRLESSRSAAEVEAMEHEKTAREIQGRITTLSGQITTAEERAEMLTRRVEELNDQMVATSQRCENLEAEVEKTGRQIDEQSSALDDLQNQSQQFETQVAEAMEGHTRAQHDIARIDAALADEKAGTMDLLRRTAQLHNEVHGHKVKQENLQGQQQRLEGRSAEVAQAVEQIAGEQGEYQGRLDDVRDVLDDAHRRLEDARAEHSRLDENAQALLNDLGEAREQRSGLLSRIDAIQEMQTRYEGVADGVRRVLEARNEGGLDGIRGMLGEFCQTDRGHTQVVAAALAGLEETLVADRWPEAEQRARLDEALGEAGSVELLCLDRLAPLREDFAVADCPHLKGRVVQWVQCEPWLAPLLWRLLGRSYLADDLPAARAAAAMAPAGSRFVTAAGDVLEPDGRVRLRAANRSAGVIARRSELADLQQQLGQLDTRIAELETRRASLAEEISHVEQVQQQLRTAIYEANTERVEAESKLAQLTEKLQTLQREQPVLAADLKQVAEDIEQAVAAEHHARQQAEELEERNRQKQEQIDRLTAELAEARQNAEQLGAQLTELKVARAEATEKVRSMTDHLGSLKRQREQMQQDIEAGRNEIQLHRQRRADAEENIAASRRDVEAHYGELEHLRVEAREAEESRQGLADRINETRKEIAVKKKAADDAGQNVSNARVQLNETDVRIENLISRASEEMDMDVHGLYGDYEHDDQRDWDAVEAEIADLRGKISRLGNVNLDAITEQEELEKRQGFLAEQLADVDHSRKQLEDLIRRINHESRERFTATFDDIRRNFQELFRKLFGGGRADVYLMDPEDVLQSGIEVVARPPGKEPQSISLLSGGEKTMTALALLFSIFRSRPSPVCLLDEVDAALDETNNERFNRLVKEFMDTSQFIVITHAKRTMSMAGVLYGVTQQEAGVSKRISVRFAEAADLAEDELQPAGA